MIVSSSSLLLVVASKVASVQYAEGTCKEARLQRENELSEPKARQPSVSLDVVVQFESELWELCSGSGRGPGVGGGHSAAAR